MKKKSVFAIIFTVILAFNLAGCSDQANQASESYIESYTQVESEKLMQSKDSYVGDNSAVINIVTGLPGNRYQPSFRLQTKEEPYEIAIHYTVNEEVADESYLNFWSDQRTKKILETNAIILFSLIANVDRIEFEIDDVSDDSYEYTRQELESTYNLDLADLSLNADSLEDFLKSKE